MRLAYLWLRRGVGPWLFVPIAGFMVASPLIDQPWRLEFDWGVRYLAASVFIFSPFVAAAAAHDVARRTRPTMYDVALGSPRGVWAVTSPALAVLCWSVLASMVSWAVVGVVVARNGGIGPSDPWIFLETVTAFAAAAVLGAVVGAYVEGLTAVAVAAGVVLMSAVLFGAGGISLFQVASSSGTMLGIERTPTRAILAIAANSSIIVAGVVLTASRLHAMRTPAAWGTGTAILVAVLAGLSAWWPVTDSEYRPSQELYSCVDDGVVVCAPAKASRLSQRAAEDLGVARQQLSASGLELPTRFAVVRGVAVGQLPPDTALLDYDTSTLVDGHLSPETVANTFATPRACAAFFSDAESRAYLEYVETVRSWILVELVEGLGRRAPTGVRDAYQQLSSCKLLGE